MKHVQNCRADRYPVRVHLDADAGRTSHEVTPFCQIDADGRCDQFWHVHDGPVRPPLWARLLGADERNA